jgi:hypothetical protein
VEFVAKLGAAYLDKVRVNEGVRELTTALQLNPTTHERPKQLEPYGTSA